MRELSGIISAMLTPFVSDVGPVDYEWIPAYLRFLERNGIHGVLASGTTGEGPSMSLVERERTLEVVLENKGNLFVFAGTGCPALTDTVVLSNYALTHGADAVVVMPPFYIKTPDEVGVLNYYRALCDALPEDARVIVYHIPQVTQVPITATIINGLIDSHASQFYGIKDSSGDWAHTSALIEQYPSLQIYSGSDHLIAKALAHNAAGAMTALSSAFPRAARAVYDAHVSGGDIETTQQRLSALRSLFTMPNMQPALKAALAWTSDLPETYVRLPLVALSDTEVSRLQEAYEQIMG